MRKLGSCLARNLFNLKDESYHGNSNSGLYAVTRKLLQDGDHNSNPGI